jgi:hypothetical protein
MATSSSGRGIFKSAKNHSVKWSFTVDNLDRFIKLRDELLPKIDRVPLEPFLRDVLGVRGSNLRGFAESHGAKVYRLLNDNGKWQLFIDADDADKLVREYCAG